MKNIHLRLLLAAGLAMLIPGRSPAQSANCLKSTANFKGSASVNYGNLTNAFNSQNRASLSVGQLAVGDYIGQDNTGVFGYWGRYLMPPLPPDVHATEGDLPDRIVVSWAPDPLGASPEAGYKIYRNGAYLAAVDKNTLNFTDFNILAGEFYTYQVSGSNQYGEGSKGSALGFLNPNGVVTGQVRSTTGNSVPGVTVELTPTLGTALAFNGDDHLFAEYDAGLVSSKWTVSFWVKIDNGNDRSGILDFGKAVNKNWWFLTTAAGQKKGVVVGIAGNELSYEFPDNGAGDWHYVAATHNSASLLLYVDGELVATKVAPYGAGTSRLFMGSLSDDTKFFNGSLDEVRLFNRQLSQTELQQFMHQTVPSNAPGLVAYWKLDEGTGAKSFSLAGNRNIGYLCGPQWSDDRPDVKNAGITDASGFYQIDGVNYGSGNTFSASARKSFYFNQSLEFNGVNQQHVELPDFDVSDTATITLWLKSFDFNSYQQIIHKNASTNIFDLNVNQGQLELRLGQSSTKQFGAMPPGFHHLAITMIHVGSTIAAQVFMDGQSLGTHNYSYGNHNWSGSPWRVGVFVDFSGVFKDYFSGLIDEIAFFDKALTPAEIQTYFNTGTDVTSQRLQHYFNFNEGSGTAVADLGTALGPAGTIHGATWAPTAALPQTAPHEFSPDARLVTLNPSNTSTDGVDFTDQSTIPVSGYVRYEGTDCFVDSMEILVNGATHNPPLFTDADGKFVLDMEPGASATLTPKYHDHVFYPAFWEVKNVSTPVAGILFRDQTKRALEGQIAGGDCRQSIIPAGAKVKVKVASDDGCFEKVLELNHQDNADGRYKFTGLPPMKMTVSIVEHSNPFIYGYFQVAGGTSFDLTELNDTIDFTYYALPEIEIAPLPTNTCGKQILEQYSRYEVEIKVKESYDGGVCYVDTAILSISNEFSEGNPQVDTTMTNGTFRLKFMAGLPNIVDPFLKTLTVTADVNGRLATETAQAVITGERPRVGTFTTTTPNIPLVILRDPPGDGSYAYWEKGQSFCTSWSFDIGESQGDGLVEKVSLGPNITTSIGGGFIVETSTDIDVDVVAEEEGDFVWTKGQNRSTSQEVCFTSKEVLQTSEEENVVGEMGGDVFLGGALNIIYGVTDKLLFDEKNCIFYRDTSIIMSPNRFATTYSYSEHHIRNDVIPDLESLGETAAVKNWENILAYNDKLKKEAVFKKNISFDAGAVYEYSEEADTLKASSFTTEITFDEDFIAQGGLFVNDVGASLGYHLVIHTEDIKTYDTTRQNVITTGYVLKDNEPGDNFTLDVKMDKRYGTPVFDVKAGESSCPHEPGTQPREEVDLTVNTTSIANVAANDAAVFVFKLGNTSQTEETRVYNFTLINESNPDGAVVKVNGMPLQDVPFQLSFGQGQVVTVTVERGPVAYTYKDLQIAIYSPCESDRAEALSLDNIDPKFFKSVFLNVYFIEPCSPVDIGFPLQDWVHTPDGGDELQVTLNSYNEADADLKQIRLQYRRTQGDGSWINIAEVPKADLGPVFKIVPWNNAGLQDGLYEIRAVTQCFGSLPAGISHVIKGKIERRPPELLGTPEPADGVLSPGDEISITFTEPIRCNQIIQADQVNLNNLGLYNTETGKLVDATISCSGDKIIIVPNVPIQTIENKTLRVKTLGIKDLADNTSSLIEWEFFVDRNPLHWVGSDIKMVKYPDQTVVLTRQIENLGGQTLNWSLSNIPNWVRIFPKLGQLAPGAAETVSFEFKNDMVPGDFKQTILMEGTFGNEPLTIDARVVCRPPDWEVDPGKYDFSMTMSLELDIEGEISQDEEDIIAAFIDGQVRGLAKVQYNSVVDSYLVFLTVYSNDLNTGDITFQIWDASDCRLFGTTAETFVFGANEVIGLPNMPQVIHTNNLLLRNIPLNNGWNWISFNLEFPDNSLNAALAGLDNLPGGLIKSQSAFSVYDPALGWVGSLTALANTPMYQLSVPLKDTIEMLGHPIDLAAVSIPLVSGWNWIGYLPQAPLPVNKALASVVAANGDVVKSQTQFAQYLPGFGWVGNLDFMEAPKGYLLKVADPGILTYPDKPGFQTQPPVSADRNDAPAPAQLHWTVDPSEYEFTMTLIGMLSANDVNTTTGDHEIAAFAGGTLRGTTRAIFIEPLQQWMFFLTVYANTAGEALQFRLFDSAQAMEFGLNETMVFTANGQEGSIQNPMPFTLETSATHSGPLPGVTQFEVFPNPFNDRLNLRFHSGNSRTGYITVTDMLGVLHFRAPVSIVSGLNTWSWDGRSDTGGLLPAGLYTVQLEAEEEVLTRKVLRNP
ncbi:MAG: Ig-like domain-containing protein [Saprospiraceae bacterium]|nr:Ig-like domain-containing protein [Saprospiraceae bacterium]